MKYPGHIILKTAGFFFIFFSLFPSLEAQKTDIMILSNGNRITCEIKGMILGTLKVKTDDMRTLEIDWSHVKSLRSDKVFEVCMSDGMTYYASFDTTSRPGKIAVVIQFKPEYRSYTVNIWDIVSIVQLKNIIWSRFKGNFSLGLGISKANQLRSFNANAQVEYTSRKINTQIQYTTNRSHTQGESQNMDQSLTLSGYHYIAKKWVAGSSEGLDRNTELGLKNRIYCFQQQKSNN